jgi:RNA-directed DNA polymerase
MQKLEALRSVKSLAGLANLLGFKSSALGYLLFKLPAASKYRTFTIPKRSGGERTISAPDARLKLLQKKVSNLLNDCLTEIEGGFSSPAHGFKPNRSIFTNAAHHRGRRYVLNLDLEDFFPSIHFGRISGYFEKSKHFGLDQKVARNLANIICHNSALPQGAPSSPVVSNLLARMLDVHLARLAKRNRLTYTRYADDLTFSTNLKVFPESVAKQTADHEWELGEDLIAAIKSSGFRINDKKTRMLYRTSRQEVTGLVVNDRVSVPVEYRRWARAAVARLVRKGKYFEPIPRSFVGPPRADPSAGSLAGSLDHLEGCLSHIYNAHRFQRNRSSLGKAPKVAAEELHSDESVYRKFLYYSKFFLADKPPIVCEGETDSIYLASAISALGDAYPALINAQLKKGEKDRFNIRFVKHSEVAGRLLELNGGTAALKRFCSIYVDQTKKFLSGAPSKPIIVVVDFDNAGRDVINYVKAIAKKQGLPDIAGLKYVFARPNLYVVWVPSPSKADYVMENLFSDELLKKTLGDKVLTLSNHKALEGEYGKMWFAKKVVPNAQAKDFVGFQPLLDTLVEVMADFSSRIQAPPAAKKA